MTMQSRADQPGMFVDDWTVQVVQRPEETLDPAVLQVGALLFYPRDLDGELGMIIAREHSPQGELSAVRVELVTGGVTSYTAEQLASARPLAVVMLGEAWREMSATYRRLPEGSRVLLADGTLADIANGRWVDALTRERLLLPLIPRVTLLREGPAPLGAQERR